MDATKEITNKGNEIEGREVKIEKTKETEDKKEEIKVKESEKKVTNEEEEEELEEDDNDDEKEKIALKGQKVIIELNNNLKNHIKEKKFELNNKLTFDFEFIYDIISRKILYKKLDNANNRKILLWLRRCDNLCNGVEVPKYESSKF